MAGEGAAPPLGVSTLFPSFVFNREHPAAGRLNAELLALGTRLRSEDVSGRSISNRGGWQSDADLMKYPECRPLVRFIEATLVDIKAFLSAADDVRFRVSSCWMNINGSGSYNSTHIHGNSYFSGVYYVVADPEMGSIVFRDPSNLREYFSFPYREVTERNAFTQSFEPAPGRMFVFPAYLPHEVMANRTERERISVAFNITAR